MAKFDKYAIYNLCRLLLSLLITMGLGLIIRILLPRVFGVEKMGMFYFAESICYITFTFLSLGIHAYINRHVPGQPEEANRVFWSIFQFKSIYGVLLGVCLYFYLYFMGYGDDSVNLIMIFAIHHFLQTLAIEIMKPFLLALEKVRLVTRIEIISKVLQVLAVVFVVLMKPDLLAVVWALAITSAIPVIMMLHYAFREGWLRQKFRWQTCKEVILIGLPFFINGALITLYSNIDIAILNELGNRTEVGLYGAAQKLKGVSLMIVPLLSSGILPFLSKKRKENESLYEDYLRQIYRVLVVLSFPAAAVMMIFSSEFVALLYGSEFAESARILVILAPVVIFTYINVYLSMNLSLVSDGKMLTVVTLVAVIFNAIANYIFIPYGMELRPVGGGGSAASITTLVAEALTFFGLLYITPTRLLRGRTFWESLFTALPLAGLLLFMDWILALDILEKCGLMLLLLLYMLLTGMIRRKDIDFFR